MHSNHKKQSEFRIHKALNKDGYMKSSKSSNIKTCISKIILLPPQYYYQFVSITLYKI